MVDPEEPRPTPESACLERTRSAVLNVLVVAGAGIAVSGWALGRLDAGALDWDRETGQRWAYGTLAAIIGLSHGWRRWGSGRAALHDPATRAERFYRSHLISALLAALAVPLGHAYGWGIFPRLTGVLPFWVAALTLGFLAVPRASEVRDFDQPWPEVEPSTGPRSRGKSKGQSKAAVGGEA